MTTSNAERRSVATITNISFSNVYTSRTLPVYLDFKPVRFTVGMHKCLHHINCDVQFVCTRQLPFSPIGGE